MTENELAEIEARRFDVDCFFPDVQDPDGFYCRAEDLVALAREVRRLRSLATIADSVLATEAALLIGSAPDSHHWNRHINELNEWSARIRAVIGETPAGTPEQRISEERT